MNELILALIFIFPPTMVLLFYLARFIATKKAEAVLLNEKIAPYLFPLYLVLSASFRLSPLRNFLEWLGLSRDIAAAILIFAVLDNIFLFFLAERRIGKVLKAYAGYLKHDTSEFSLVVLLALLSGLVTFFKTRAVYESPFLLTTLVFIGVLLILPLLLYYYHDLQLELKFEVKSELFLDLIKMVFFIICPLMFIRIFKALLISGSIFEITIVFVIWVMELLMLFLLWRKIIMIPKIITDSFVYKNTKTHIENFSKKAILYIYHHVEIAAVLLLIFIVSWPIVIAHIDEYRNWRSNFPVIKKATPVIGMQGTIVILFGDNFGTTGLGIPGSVLVGTTKLVTVEWNDHKIVAIIPVPPPSDGELYVKKNFKWDGKNYSANSNYMKFKQFDWAKADAVDIDRFLEMLNEQY